jgi:hypothetical protein
MEPKLTEAGRAAQTGLLEHVPVDRDGGDGLPGRIMERQVH